MTCHEKSCVANLPLHTRFLKLLVKEARTACKEYNQACTELETTQRACNPTVQYLHQRQQAYFSAVLRAMTAVAPLYDAMRRMQEVLKELSPTVRNADEVRCDEDWCAKQLLRNNFTCSVELLSC